jgi:formate C-acetyltransferase
VSLALSEGKFSASDGKLSGPTRGYPTPPISTFKSFEDVWDAFCKQVEFTGETLTLISNIADSLLKKYIPRPFLSAILDGNIERACDMRDWEYLGLRHHMVWGVNNAADGLMAIKKLVFDEKKLTLETFVKAVESNYQGEYEWVRREIESGVPRFGNDNDEVDALSKKIMLKAKEVADHSIDIYGKPYILDGTTASGPIEAGMRQPATFDGRRACEPFHDGSISPVQGRDTSGPTAVIRSVAKVDPLQTGNLLLNQKFMPEFFDPPNYGLMEGYVKTLCDWGIHHVQFNCVDKNTLLEAKAKPENYENLIVRVAGYSAYFVDLDNRIQDEIITRTEQSFS